MNASTGSPGRRIRRVQRRLIVGLAAIGLVAAGLVGANAASAATGFDRCPAGYLCLFTGTNGTGTMAYFRYGSTNLGLQGMDNRVWSLRNRSGKGICGYDDYSYRGQAVLIYMPAYATWGYNTGSYVATHMSSVKVGC